jgi:ATP-dependent DNA helicase RecG
LFGENPQLTFPQARISFLIEQNDMDSIIKDFEGPVLMQPAKIQEYLKIIYPEYISRKSMQSDMYFNVPMEAVREIINNAVAHRDYSLNGMTIKVYIYDDRVEVYSPGKPIHPIEKFREFKVPPISRNPKIAYLFHQMHVVEEVGFGMKELKKIADQHIFPIPSFRLDDQYFITTLYTKPGAKRSTFDIEDKLKKLNEIEKKGYNIISVRGSITSKEYQIALHIADRTARYHLKKMVELGLIIFEGAGKSTIYRIKE